MVMPVKLNPNTVYTIGPCPKCGRSFNWTGNPPRRKDCCVTLSATPFCPTLRTLPAIVTPDDKPTLET